MPGHISNASVNSISSDCVNGTRSVSVHVGAKQENGVWRNASLDVWVPEELSDIEAIKQEALRLAKIFAADISATDLLPSDTSTIDKPAAIERALEPADDPGY